MYGGRVQRSKDSGAGLTRTGPNTKHWFTTVPESNVQAESL